MNLEELTLIDASDKKVDTVRMPPRAEGQGPRSVIYKGKRFEEPDGESFYDAGILVEVT